MSSLDSGLSSTSRIRDSVVRRATCFYLCFTLSAVLVLTQVTTFDLYTYLPHFTWGNQQRLAFTIEDGSASADSQLERTEAASSRSAESMQEFSGENPSNAKPENESNTTSTTPSSCIPIQPLSWEWNYFRNQTDNKTSNAVDGVVEDKQRVKTPKKKLLIGLYSGYDKYASMLEVTAPVNKAYAKLWGHDLVVLQGTYLILPNEKADNCTPNGRRVTFNKIALLDYAIENSHKYDQLLLVDTDAMVYDFSYDVTTLITDEMMLAAHRVKLKDVVHTWDVNAGVTLWNLHHPKTAMVAQSWLNFSTHVLTNESPTKGDQRELHAALQATHTKDFVVSYENEFAYGHGTVIRHYIRKVAHKGWNDPNILENRLDRLQQQATEVCTKQPRDVCDGIDPVKYTTTSSTNAKTMTAKTTTGTV